MKLRELLTDESKWHKGYYAVDEHGQECDEKDRVACKWCLLGAIERCGVSDGPIRAALPKEYDWSIVMFNDDPKTTFADVCAVIEKAGV